MLLLCPALYSLQKGNITKGKEEKKKEKKMKRKKEKHCSKIKDWFKFFLQWDSPQIKRNLFFIPTKSSQSSPCFCLVLQLCIVQHLKPILFQVWWVSLFCFGFVGVCFRVHNSGLPWFGECEAHAYAMFISQFSFPEWCTDLHRTAAGEVPG